ncbi:hypothetical protein HRbin19_00428 [bacterium HR19]|nr:hypothetical protein HRbin19_00428 [bacterium HR19]
MKLTLEKDKLLIFFFFIFFSCSGTSEVNLGSAYFSFSSTYRLIKFLRDGVFPKSWTDPSDFFEKLYNFFTVLFPNYKSIIQVKPFSTRDFSNCITSAIFPDSTYVFGECSEFTEDKDDKSVPLILIRSSYICSDIKSTKNCKGKIEYFFNILGWCIDNLDYLSCSDIFRNFSVSYFYFFSEFSYLSAETQSTAYTLSINIDYFSTSITLFSEYKDRRTILMRYNSEIRDFSFMYEVYSKIILNVYFDGKSLLSYMNSPEGTCYTVKSDFKTKEPLIYIFPDFSQRFGEDNFAYCPEKGVININTNSRSFQIDFAKAQCQELINSSKDFERNSSSCSP